MSNILSPCFKTLNHLLNPTLPFIRPTSTLLKPQPSAGTFTPTAHARKAVEAVYSGSKANIVSAAAAPGKILDPSTSGKFCATYDW